MTNRSHGRDQKIEEVLLAEKGSSPNEIEI